MDIMYRSSHSITRYQRSRPQWLSRVTLAVTLLTALLAPASAQFGEFSEMADDAASASPKKLEDTVVTDMLRIVDNKFDTLTTRITSLERAVSNLQFFSIRQFRQMSGSLQLVAESVDTVSAQVGKLEVDGRGLKITSSLLHREVTEIKSMTSGLSNELASSRAHFSSSIEKQNKFIKTIVRDTLFKISQDSKTFMNKSVEAVYARFSQEEDRHPENCSVDFAPLQDHVDHKFSYLKRDIYNTVSNLVKTENAETATKCEDILKRYQEDIRRLPRKIFVPPTVETIDEDQMLEKNRSAKFFGLSKRERLNLKKNAKQSTTADVPPRGLGDIVKGNIPTLAVKSEQSAPSSQRNTTKTSGQAWQNEMDAMVMEALTNMTTSVQQAVSFFRNTAHLLERIVSNTDMLLEAQTSPSGNARALPVNTGRRIRYQSGPLAEGPGGFDFRAAMSRHRMAGLPIDAVPIQPPRSRECVLNDELAENIATIVKNGSQLLEILTDLAQVSSMSLTQATSKLQTHISGVEAIQERMEAVLLSAIEAASGVGKEGLAKLSNSTEKIFKLVEAIAANTGWLPFIYNNVKHMDVVGNRTLHFVSKNHGMLRHIMYAEKQQKQQQQQPRPEDNSSGERLSGGSSREIAVRDRRREGSAREEFTLDERSLETIYSTSVQLHRIMPALTKLLAEPDPLFTLVDGGRPDQGRVEIYHMGQWGALCHGDLSHVEADAICRHLGFQGGISAGMGHYGAGAGVTWSINASCLAKSKCAAVEHVKTLSPCSHERDAAVICDHMLRIDTVADINPESTGTIGRVEIHHRGIWLPICGDGWSGYSARVACKQMGYTDGREKQLEQWLPGRNFTWMARVMCNGTETRLDACPTNGWTRSCENLEPAGVLCL